MKKAKVSSFEPGLKKRVGADLWRFTPEDLARLMAAAADQPRPGWHHANTNAARAKAQATRRRTKVERQRAITVAWHAAHAVKDMARQRNGATARVLDAMRLSGEWLGVRDVIRLSGVSRNSVHAIMYQKLAPWGFVERTQNPAYVGSGTPWTRWSLGAGVVEPRFLWRAVAPAVGLGEGKEKTPDPETGGKVAQGSLNRLR